MKVHTQLSSLKRTQWKAFAVRFVFGGLITVAAGLIAHQFGPTVGGLFLAFPAILPAGLTLVEKHEREREQSHGEQAPRRACQAAGVTAAGAAIGSIGLFAFGMVIWGLAAHVPAWGTLSLAAVAWGIVSFLGWAIRQKL